MRLLAMIPVVDYALKLRFKASPLVPRNEPLVVGQGSEALLHPLLSVVVATDEPKQEEEQEGAKYDIFDDYTGLGEPERVVDIVVVVLKGWVARRCLAGQDHGCECGQTVMAICVIWSFEVRESQRATRG